MSSVWIIRAGRDGDHQQFALDNDCVVIGFNWMGGKIDYSSLEDCKADCREKTKEKNNYRLAQKAGQPFHFANTIQQQDMVILPLKNSGRRSAIGEINGNYKYHDEAEEGRKHRRPVKWLNKSVPNTAIPHSLTSYLTVSKIKDERMAQKIIELLEGKEISYAMDDDDAPTQKSGSSEDTPDDIIAEAQKDSVEFAAEKVREKIREAFPGDELTLLIKEILEAEGFDCMGTQQSHDKGVDLLVSRGKLGFGNSICVQVKNTRSLQGAPALRDFRGAMQEHGVDKGIFVSWGGFSVESKMRQENFPNVRLWNAEDIMRFVEKHYDGFSDTIKQCMPLKQVFMWDDESSERRQTDG